MYDYVIVGAGSAGCVLASRLSEDPDVSVLLLEAGPPDTKENIHVPLGFLQLFKTDVDWDYATAPEPVCDHRRMHLPRGKTLGGSSSTNAMVYIRGNRLDYDSWGADGWRYDDLLPYFKRSEDNERGADEFHGAGGPLRVADRRYDNPMMDAWLEAAVDAGLPRNADFNGATQDGVGHYQVTQRDGMRCSAAVAYLHPAMQRPNLTVLPWMHVHRIVFEGTRAVAVEAAQLGEVKSFRAQREVLLCAGAYNSPQLLMLSGVGEPEHLTMRQIPVVLDQPRVGENLIDHVVSYLVYTTDEPVSLLLSLEPEALEQYEADRTGVLTSNFAETGGFARVDPGAAAPDIQYHAVPIQIVDEGTADPTAHGMWVSPCLLQPASRGSVRLASADPYAKPIIRHNYFTADQDMRTMLEGLRRLLDICGRPALGPYARPFTVPSGDSEEALRAHVRRYSATLYHPVGTCAIGSVVDAELRVMGLEGLRVIDASVMPMVPRGNTNAPTIALAERAADVIRGRVPERAGQRAQPAAA